MRLTHYLIGYRIFTVKEEEIALCARLFLTNGISVRFKNNTFSADAVKARRIEKILDGKLEYTKSELYGLGGFAYKNRKRYGAMLAILLSVIIFIISSDRVWDVRIEGCESTYSEQIKRNLNYAVFPLAQAGRKPT